MLWAKVAKELMAELEKRVINFFSLEKVIGHCLKITKEKQSCWNLLFIAKQLWCAEIYWECQVNRKPFMLLPSPWDLARGFENQLVKGKKPTWNQSFIQGKRSLCSEQCLVHYILLVMPSCLGEGIVSVLHSKFDISLKSQTKKIIGISTSPKVKVRAAQEKSWVWGGEVGERRCGQFLEITKTPVRLIVFTSASYSLYMMWTWMRPGKASGRELPFSSSAGIAWKKLSSSLQHCWCRGHVSIGLLWEEKNQVWAPHKYHTNTGILSSQAGELVLP